MGELLLGVDVGTYSSKAVLTDAAGTVLAAESIEHGLDLPRPGWAEQDADAVWWSDVVALCRRLLSRRWQPSDVAAMCVSAIGPCLVALDERDRPLRPAILYGIDTRAAAEVDELQELIGRDALLRQCGLTLSSQAVGPKVLWLQRNEPDAWARTRTLTTASAYLVRRLTGEHVIDRHTAAHFAPLTDVEAQGWSGPWSDRLLDGRMLPRQEWSDRVAGTVTAEAAHETGLLEGTPVAVGTVDALAEALSVGVADPGDLMVMYGSTTFFLLRTTEPLPDPQLWSLPGAFEGDHFLAAGMATTGALTRWFRDELCSGTSYAELFGAAADVEPGCGGVLVLPYFSGERTPRNDPHARGVVVGLSLSTTRAELFRAVLESVALGVRHHLDAFRARGAGVERVVAIGGGAQSAVWPQIVSDVTGVPQVLPRATAGACRGDALLAGIAVGLCSRDDVRSWGATAATIEPDPALATLYDARYADFLELYDSTRPVVHRLAISAAHEGG